MNLMGDCAILRRAKRSSCAFSLFELLICVVILGVIGIICSSMLLNISKNLSALRIQNDKAAPIALLKIENILQYAIPQLLTFNTPPSAQNNIEFIRIDEAVLLGNGDKVNPANIYNETTLPKIPIRIESYIDNSIYMPSTEGWNGVSSLVLFAFNAPKFYEIDRIYANRITLLDSIQSRPFIAIPATSHKIFLENTTLYFDNIVLAHNVSEFLITPHTLKDDSVFLSLRLCIAKSCHSGGVWLENIIESR